MDCWISLNADDKDDLNPQALLNGGGTQTHKRSFTPTCHSVMQHQELSPKNPVTQPTLQRPYISVGPLDGQIKGQEQYKKDLVQRI